MIGRVLGFVGEWSLLERLGEGGMGEVYRAYHPDYGECALKVQSALASPERFLREARISSRLDHPHIVRMVAYGQDDYLGRIAAWIAFERIEGVTLDALVRSRPLTDDEQAFVVRAVCEALAYAHSLRVLHRDLKPENILIEVDHEGWITGLKIIDFGIATAEWGMPALTVTRAGPLGTPAYMAPEQWVDPKRATPATDVWAIALIAYFVMTRTDPFLTDEVRSDVMLPLLERGLLPAANTFPSVFEVLRIATRYDFRVRYQRVEQFWEAFSYAWTRDASEAAEAPTNVLPYAPEPPPFMDDDVATRMVGVDWDPWREIEGGFQGEWVEAEAVPRVLPTEDARTPPVVPTVAVDARPFIPPTLEAQPPQLRSERVAPPSLDRRRWIALSVVVLFITAMLVVLWRVLDEGEASPSSEQDSGDVYVPSPSPRTTDDVPPVDDAPPLVSIPPARPTPPPENPRPTVSRRTSRSRPPSSSEPAPPRLSERELCELERSSLGLPYNSRGQVVLPSLQDGSWWALDPGYRARVCQFMARCMDRSQGSMDAFQRRCAPPPVRVDPY